MMHDMGSRNHQPILKLIGTAVLCFAALTALARSSAADMTATTQPANPTTLPAVLHISSEITPGKFTPLRGSTAYLDVLSVELEPSGEKCRFLIGHRFTSRNVKGAKLHLKLLAANGGLLAEVTHTAEVGPEVTRQQAGHYYIIEKWDDERAVWLDLPVSAEEVAAFTLDIEAM